MTDEQCGVRWRNGWGWHFCHLPKNHINGLQPTDHRCRCDATISERGLYLTRTRGPNYWGEP
jgi:hypothetical protein